ncbi:MAG: hypothetical protein DRQ44_12540 [Gammaproteobacteria bacterium]|nr:MAG: hypothetical protein DRQ44_12540 [Gammaproteobacteria bacterium]
MSNLLKKCLIDTNVPKTANLSLNPATIPQELIGCVQACVEAVDHTVKKGGLVLDSNDEIYNEYRRNLSLSGQPGVGDGFMKWVHDNRWKLPDADRVTITKSGDSYDEFPDHDGLIQFDKSDRKFIAVANAHPEKPPVLQATDSKWWGWKDALKEVGITVQFLCTDYVELKYQEKFGT